MKHINKYDKFIKLNEDVKIDGDINEYDVSLIKDGLIELQDLGLKIYRIVNYAEENEDIINIILKISTTQITQCVRYFCKFDKMSFDLNSECFLDNNTDEIHEPTTYEQQIIYNIKECSIVLLNMLDCDKGWVRIGGHTDVFHASEMLIHFSKNKTK